MIKEVQNYIDIYMNNFSGAAAAAVSVVIAEKIIVIYIYTEYYMFE